MYHFIFSEKCLYCSVFILIDLKSVRHSFEVKAIKTKFHPIK